jgi:hypothetical protein
MDMQMYIVTFKDEATADTARAIEEQVRRCGGFILMATRSGPLVLLPPAAVAVVAKHPRVGFVGGVTLDPSALAAQHLQRVFLENLTRQLQTPKTG